MKKYVAFFCTIMIFLCSCQRTSTVQVIGGGKGNQLLNEEKNEEAVAYYKEELEEAIQKYGEQSEEVGTIYNNLCVAYLDLEQYDKSLECANKARIVSETLDDDAGLAIIYTNLGEVYFYMQDYSVALDHYKSSLKINQRLYGKSSQAAILDEHMIADTYRELEEYDRALEVLDEVIDIDLRENGEMSNSLRYAYRRKGRIYKRMNDISNAEKFYGMAIENNERFYETDKEFEASTYQELGMVFDDNAPEKAVEDYQKALEYYSKSEDGIDNQVYLYGQLMKNYQVLGDFEKAQEYGIKTCTLTERYGTEAGVSEEEITDYKEKLKEVYCQITKDEDGTSFDSWYKENVLKEETD